MPRTYAYHEIRDVYDMLRDRGEVTETLPEWSQKQNALTGSRAFDSGVDEGYILKPLMYHARSLIGATGLPTVVGAIGEGVGGLLGNAQLGREVGEGAAYGAVNLLPMLIPGIGPVAMAGSMGALAAANTYADTNSVGSALTSGAIAGLMPGVANKAEQFVLRRMGGEAIADAGVLGMSNSMANRLYAMNGRQGAAALLGGQVAASGFSEVGRMAEAGMTPDNPDDPNSMYDFSPTRLALEMTVGQLPFAATYLSKNARVGLGGQATRDYVADLNRMVTVQKLKNEITEARMRAEEGHPLSADLPERPTVLSAEQQGKIDAALNFEPPDPKLTELFQKAQSAQQKFDADPNSISAQEVATLRADADAGLAGQEHKVVSNGLEPLTKITGVVKYDHPDYPSRLIELDDSPQNQAAGLTPGTTIRYWPKNNQKLSQLTAGEFEVPLAGIDRDVQDKFPHFWERKKREARERVDLENAQNGIFQDPNTFYRVVVGDDAFQDIVNSGLVRTNAGSKGGQSLAEKLASRPTAFPSFSKGEASMEYAAANPNHYIISTTDPSIQPSTAGRHGKGSTMFPTDATGAHLTSLPATAVKVWKHKGNGKYELVYEKGQAKSMQPDLPVNTETKGYEKLRQEHDDWFEEQKRVAEQVREDAARLLDSMKDGVTEGSKFAEVLNKVNNLFRENGQVPPYQTQQQIDAVREGMRMGKNGLIESVMVAQKEAENQTATIKDKAKKKLDSLDDAQKLLQEQIVLSTQKDAEGKLTAEAEKAKRLVDEFNKATQEWNLTSAQDLTVYQSWAKWVRSGAEIEFRPTSGRSATGVGSSDALIRTGMEDNSLNSQVDLDTHESVREVGAEPEVALRDRVAEAKTPEDKAIALLNEKGTWQVIKNAGNKVFDGTPAQLNQDFEKFTSAKERGTKLSEDFLSQPHVKVWESLFDKVVNTFKPKSFPAPPRQEDIPHSSFLQRLKDIVAGNPVVVFHGSDQPNLTELEFSGWVSASPQTSRRYADNRASANGVGANLGKKGFVYKTMASVPDYGNHTMAYTRAKELLAAVESGKLTESEARDIYYEGEREFQVAPKTKLEPLSDSEYEQLLSAGNQKSFPAPPRQDEILTMSEREAVHEYAASAVGFNDKNPQGRVVALVEALDSAVQKADPLAIDTLYRAVDRNYFENQGLEVGSSVKPVGFTSTSANKKATQSTDYVQDAERVTITIKGVKGVKAVDVDNVLRTNPGADKNTRIGEQEYLLGRGMEFVIESYDGKNSVWRLVKNESFAAPPRQDSGVSRTSAGGGFLWDFVGYDAVTNRIGKHTIPKDGLLTIGQFKNMAGEPVLSNVVIELGKLVVPEAFTEDGKVNVKVLEVGLKEKGPVVEVKKLGEGQAAPAVRELAELRHSFLDALPLQEKAEIEGYLRFGSEEYLEGSSPEVIANAKRMRELIRETTDPFNVPTNNSPKYSFLGPKSEQNMPGYVEGLVRVLQTKEKTSTNRASAKLALENAGYEVKLNRFGEVDGVYKNGEYVDVDDSSLPASLKKPYEDLLATQEGQEGQGLESTKGVKYVGPHFGSEDTNVLAFFRGYEETLPDGRKAFHVIEVQSDWGQKVRTEAEQIKKSGKDRSEFELLAQDHPLLASYETLALKAAIDHARSVGADAIILSDGETAMMTEGHDKQSVSAVVKTVTTREEADAWIQAQYAKGAERGRYVYQAAQSGGIEIKDVLDRQPSQSAGMRLHYDTTLPSAMKKLTGVEGERVEVGTHKEAINQDPRSADNRVTFPTLAEAELTARVWREEDGVPGVRITETPRGFEVTYGEATPSGSPVFRNPDGTPKANITGRMWKLEGAFAKQDQRGGFTLTNPSFVPPEPHSTFVPKDPVDTKLVSDMGATPTDNLNWVLRTSPDPITQSLAKRLLDFQDTLGRVGIEWHSGQSSATWDLRSRSGMIRYGENLLSATDTTRHFTVLHEMVHQLTLGELKNPNNTVFRDSLDALRKRAISWLPTEIRERLNWAVKTDWYGKYSREETVENLHKDTKWFNVIYGMLNIEEFASQGLTSRHMIDYLSAIQGTKGTWKNGFKEFLGNVKKFLGLGTGPESTVYDEFMHHTTGLIEFGNNAANFHTFGDTYLKLRGSLDNDRRNRQIREAQSVITRAANETLDGRGLLQELNSFAITTAKERNAAVSEQTVRARAQLERAVRDRTPVYEDLVQAGLEHGFEPSVKGVNGFFSEALDGMDNLSHRLDSLPTEVKKYMFSQVKDMGMTLDLLDAAVKQGQKGLVNMADPKSLEGPVRDALKTLNEFRKAQERHEDGLEVAQTLVDLVTPGNAIQKFGAPPLGKPAIDLKETWLGRTAKATVDLLEQGAQLARRNPLFAEAFSQMSMLSNRQTTAIQTSTEMLYREIRPDGTLGTRTAAQTAKTDKIIDTPKLNAAVDRWLWHSQNEGGTAVGLLPVTHPAVAKELKGLTPAELKEVSDFMPRAMLMKISQDQMKRQVMYEEASNYGGRIIMNQMGLKPDMAVDAAAQVLTALHTIRTGDQVMGQAQLAAIQAKLDPETFVHVLEFSRRASDVMLAEKEYDDANPMFVSAQRGGKFKFEYWKDGQKVLASADSEANARHEAKKQTGSDVIENFRENDKADLPQRGPDDEERLRSIQEKRNYQREYLVQRGISPEMLEHYDTLDVANQTEREYAATRNLGGARPFRGMRGLSKGAEHLPWLENLLTWVDKNSSYWQKRLLRVKMDTLLASPEYIKDYETSEKTKKLLGSLLSKDPEVIRGIQKFVTTWNLTANVASFVANGTQTAMRTLPELIRETGSIWKTMKAIGQGWSDYMSHKTGRADWRNPEENKFYTEAYREGKINLSQFDETAPQEADSGKLIDRINRNVPKSKVTKVISAADALGQWGMKLFKAGERANATVTLMTAFRMLRQKGLSYADAKAKAYEIHASSNDAGGRANRSIGLFDNKGSFSRGTAMLASTLQSYSLGSVSQLIRHVHEGWGKNTGLSPAESYAAKKAAMTMGAVQFAAAGALGMPFVSSLLALMNTAVPEWELSKKLREGVDWATGDSKLTEAFMTGLPSMLGWDWQSRLSSGNILPGVSEWNGFQAGQLLGAPINLAGNFAKGAAQLLQANPRGALNFVPPAIKKLTELVSEDGMIQDYKGRPVLNDLTGGEKVGLAVGFQPKRLSDFNSAQRIAEMSERNTRRDNSAERQRLAQEVLKGNFGSVQGMLKQRALSDRTFDMRSEIHAIANEAEALAFPRDLQREGTKADDANRQRLLRSFNLMPTGPDEKTRILFRQRIEQRFGLNVNKNNELRLADIMDRIDRERPGLSRVERRRLAEESLRPYLRRNGL